MKRRSTLKFRGAIATLVVITSCFGALLPSHAADLSSTNKLFPVSLSDDLQLVFARSKPGQLDNYLRWSEQHLKDHFTVPGIEAGQRFMLVKESEINGSLLDYMTMYDIDAAREPGMLDIFLSKIKQGLMDPGTNVVDPSQFALMYRPLSVAVSAQTIPGSNPTPIGTGPLSEDYLVVLSDPSTPDQEEAFNNWYNHQHIPDVLRVPGFELAQRFIRVGGPWKFPRYLVIFKFASRDVAATNHEVGRRIQQKITVMSPAFGLKGASGAMATPIGPAMFADDGSSTP